MFQDIREPRRSLREVLPSRKKKEVEDNIYHIPPPPRSSRRPGLFIFLLVLVLVIIVVVAISSLLSGANVMVTPKAATLTFDKAAIDYAPVESMIFTPISESKLLIATGQEKVVEKATGQVVIYNNYSTAAQKLVVNTRLESKAGKIYRLVAAATVPGQKTVAGKLTPGSIEVKVIADEAGETYNSPLTDFTIPGFKGGPRYDKFYGRSKTAITGGLTGNQPVVAAADREKAVKELHASLTQKLLTQSRTQIPESFILYDNTAMFEFADKLVAGSGSSSSQATLTSTINGTGYLLNREILTTELMTTQANELDGLTVELSSLDLLDVKISSTAQATTTKDKVLKLIVSGTTQAIAQVDVAKLKAALADQPKAQAGAIFNSFAEIQSAKISLTPPWLRRFPQNPAKIKIQFLSANK